MKVSTPAAIVLPGPQPNETPMERRIRIEADKRWIRKVAELAEAAETGMGHVYSGLLLD